MARKRYEMRQPELNTLIDRLVEEVGAADAESAESVRQMIVTSLRLLRDDATRGDLKLLNNALKELRHGFRVFAPYANVRKVSCFGSARTQPGHPDWQQAAAFAKRMVTEGWMVITGAGDGIMGAAQTGAGRERSFGLNIRLPFEQKPNEVIAGDDKLMNFRYFFTRKVMFVKEAHAIALFPGGFGTHDEALEALTLMQTGKGEIQPVVLVDTPGERYWRDWQEYVERHLRGAALISDDDTSLFRITDDVETAAREILNFYSNYHSSRYVGRRLVLRVRRPPRGEALKQLNEEFADIVARGAIEVCGCLPQEEGEVADLPRVVFEFTRRAVGRLRQLIDRLNAAVPETTAPPVDATPHEIVEASVRPEDERAELQEEPPPQAAK